jgi:hypothetical protein
MSSYLDIFALTRHRDFQTVNQFVNEYVDQRFFIEFGLEEHRIGPIDENDLNDIWKPEITLEECLQYGLDSQVRAFKLYLRTFEKYKSKKIEAAGLTFTKDNKLELSLSVEIIDLREEDLNYSINILHQLMAEYDCHLGLVGKRFGGSWSEAEFKQNFDHPRVLYSIQSK